MDSFDKAVAANLGWLMRLAKAMCRNSEDSEDLCGDTVYRLLRSKAKFDPSMPFRPWAVAVMQNLFISRYNRSRTVPFARLDDACEAQAPEGAMDVLQLTEAIRAIRRCSRRSVCVECVVLYAKGYAYEEIADIVGIGIGTVKSRISAGRRLIAREIGYPN